MSSDSSAGCRPRLNSVLETAVRERAGEDGEIIAQEKGCVRARQTQERGQGMGETGRRRCAGPGSRFAEKEGGPRGTACGLEMPTADQWLGGGRWSRCGVATPLLRSTLFFVPRPALAAYIHGRGACRSDPITLQSARSPGITYPSDPSSVLECPCPCLLVPGPHPLYLRDILPPHLPLQ